MCITFIFTNPGDHPIKYKLILINNRDEYYARETQNATLIPGDDDLKMIYGIDLAGAVKGTWLGVSVKNDRIRLGNLANVTGEDIKGKQGRGPIVTNFIKNDDSIENYNDELFELSHDYSAFNFLSVEINSDEIKASYVSNTPKTSNVLPLGFAGLGNSPMDAPFRKVDVGTEQFKKILESHKESERDELVNALMDLLKSDIKHFPDPELTSRRQDTAEAFSSIHVALTELGYGTRTRTVIMIDNDNNIECIEDTMATEDPQGHWETTHLKLPCSERDFVTTKL